MRCLMNKNLSSPFNSSVENSHYPDLMINEFLELNEKYLAIHLIVP